MSQTVLMRADESHLVPLSSSCVVGRGCASDVARRMSSFFRNQAVSAIEQNVTKVCVSIRRADVVSHWAVKTQKDDQGSM